VPNRGESWSKNIDLRNNSDVMRPDVTLLNMLDLRILVGKQTKGSIPAVSTLSPLLRLNLARAFCYGER
jgi:hypothetical protein